MTAQAYIKAGNWERPCLVCGRSPEDGAEFDVGAVRRGRGYRKSYCRPCATRKACEHDRQHPEKMSARQARRAPRDWPAERRRRWGSDADKMRDRIRRSSIRKNFGISLEDYKFRFESQGGLCAICDAKISLDRVPGSPHACLDHDHETGRLREFLCNRCNVMIGMAREDIDVLLSAISYLERHDGD